MQAGDLVELSSAGRQLQQNSRVYGLIGLITRIDNTNYPNHPIKIEWLGHGHYPMKRYEIKRVRATG
jgi:hypothetical protein